jgi:hypothetical protein
MVRSQAPCRGAVVLLYFAVFRFVTARDNSVRIVTTPMSTVCRKSLEGLEIRSPRLVILGGFQRWLRGGRDRWERTSLSRQTSEQKWYSYIEQRWSTLEATGPSSNTEVSDAPRAVSSAHRLRLACPTMSAGCVSAVAQTRVKVAALPSDRKGVCASISPLLLLMLLGGGMGSSALVARLRPSHQVSAVQEEKRIGPKPTPLVLALGAVAWAGYARGHALKLGLARDGRRDRFRISLAEDALLPARTPGLAA